MKINYISVQDYIKRTTVPKQKIKNCCHDVDVENLINHAKNTSFNDPKNLAEIIVMMNSIGINRILEYFK